MSTHRSSCLLLVAVSGLLGFVACDGATSAEDDPADASAEAASPSGSATGATSQDGAPPVASDSGTVVSDAGTDGGSDSGTDGGSDAGTDGGSDSGTDGGSDSGTYGGNDAGDAGSGPQPELVSPANCPRGIAYYKETLFWTESAQPGLCPGQPITPGVRMVSVAGSATLPPQLYVGANAVSTPAGIVAMGIGGALRIWFTDGQGPNNNDLWRLESDGGATRWGPAPGPIGPTALAADNAVLYWTSSQGTHLSDTTSPSRELALDTGNSGLVGGSVHSVALDADNVYSIRNQLPDRGLYACPRKDSCTGGTHKTIALEADVQAVVSDGVDVWFTGGSPAFEATTTEKVFKCPIGGCAGGTPTLFVSTQTTVDGKGTHHAMAVDKANVYWSTIAGTIYRCKKTGCEKPETLASGVRPSSFAQDSNYLYWADRRGGIYRILK